MIRNRQPIHPTSNLNSLPLSTFLQRVVVGKDAEKTYVAGKPQEYVVDLKKPESEPPEPSPEAVMEFQMLLQKLESDDMVASLPYLNQWTCLYYAMPSDLRFQVLLV